MESYSFLTACPPNSLRRAAITLAEKEFSWRDRIAGEEGKCQNGSWDLSLNRFEHCPAALAGIFDVAFDRRELGIFLKCIFCQLQ